MIRVAGVGLAVGLALGACGDDRGAGGAAGGRRSTGTTTTSRTESPSTTVALVPVTGADAGYPPARDRLEHGGATWAVVLDGGPVADGESLDQHFLAAREAAERAGYVTSPGNCDVGAPEALGLADDPGVYTISVYYRSEAQARAALEQFRRDGWTKGTVARVETFCLD